MAGKVNCPLQVKPIHLNPDHKIVTMCAVRRNGGRPGRFFGRWRASAIAERCFYLPAFVGAKEAWIVAHTMSVPWWKLDIDMTARLPNEAANEKSVLRYQRFVKELLLAGYMIDWQKPLPNCFATRADFERSLLTKQEIGRPRAYVDD